MWNRQIETLAEELIDFGLIPDQDVPRIRNLIVARKFKRYLLRGAFDHIVPSIVDMALCVFLYDRASSTPVLVWAAMSGLAIHSAYSLYEAYKGFSLLAYAKEIDRAAAFDDPRDPP